MNAAIELHGVTKTFGSATTAVDNLDLIVPEGSLCGFLGPNGAGKTTTIRMIMAIIFPDRGDISVLGKKSAVESKDQIGYLPEERGVYRKMKTIEFLVYLARLKGVDAKSAKARAKSWLERVELEHVSKKKLEELSKGMQQKVQIAATLIHDPDLVILDEPFSGLDPVNSRMLHNLIMEINGEGKTIIFSTHVLFQAEQTCNRFFMINQGRKVLDATIEEIREQFDPRTIIVQAMNGSFDPLAFKGVLKADRHHDEFEVHLKVNVDPIIVMKEMMEKERLRKIELRQPTLEDIFISLVEDAHRNEFGELEVRIS